MTSMTARTSSENVTSCCCNHFSINQRHYACEMCFTYPGIKLEPGNQRFRDKKTKLNICHHMLTSSTKLQKMSFHAVERTRTSTKCPKNGKCTCKACKTIVFHCQICKFVTFVLLMRKLPSVV